MWLSLCFLPFLWQKSWIANYCINTHMTSFNTRLGYRKIHGVRNHVIWCYRDRTGLSFGDLFTQRDEQSPNKLLYSFPYIHAFIWADSHLGTLLPHTHLFTLTNCFIMGWLLNELAHLPWPAAAAIKVSDLPFCQPQLLYPQQEACKLQLLLPFSLDGAWSLWFFIVSL